MKIYNAKVILVTGASSGIGKATALKLLSQGHIVYGAARRMENMAELVQAGGVALKVDITNEDEVDAALQAIYTRHGYVDVLINNAGFSVYGAVEETSQEDVRKQFEVNFFATTFMTQKVLPIMRERGQGHIINVSSVAGKVYTPLGAWYHATKHALEGWSDCLRVETQHLGLKVSIIEPGAIETEFSNVMMAPMLLRSGNGPYQAMAKNMVEATSQVYKDTKNTRPEIIADTIAVAVNSEAPKTRYAAGKYALLLLFLRRWLSDKYFDKLILEMVK